jgi:hypothetical protein
MPCLRIADARTCRLDIQREGLHLKELLAQLIPIDPENLGHPGEMVFV